MYALLPAVYHRYDEAQAATSDDASAVEGRARGQLRRFLDLPGSQFDQLYSMARAALAFADPDRVEGTLLPLLAQWIGWRTDYRRELSTQRNEIRFAPQIYQTIGLIPTVEATVKRITNWESKTKEFVFNVARTNQPERLNLWSAFRPPAGNFGVPALASVNFVYEGRPAAIREGDGSISFFYQTYRRQGWDIWTKRFTGGRWQPSAPVVAQQGIDRHPAAALQGGRAWLFWESYDPGQGPGERKWRINFQIRTGGTWSASAVFGDAATERRMPAAVADDTGGVWLFWLEAAAGGWRLRYNRHDGTQWLANPIDVPLDGTQDPRVESDLHVLFHPTSANQRIWLFWARHEPGGSAGQTRWSVVYRIKQGLNPATSDWSAVRALPKAAAQDHDREPYALLAAAGNIELFWSSTRGGGWTLWHDTLDIGTLTFGPALQLTTSPYSNRAPLAVDTGAGTLLTYRSNESLTHTSVVYGATQTLDARYNGATTADTRNVAKLALRGRFEDFQTYTYDAGRNGVRGNDDRIARDTIGLYLTPDTADPAAIQATVSRLANALGEFMPDSERAVFITPPRARKERPVSDYSRAPLELLVANQQKGYVGLHIEQGVPLLDRDLNLLHDLITATVRSVITRYIGNGSPTGSGRLCHPTRRPAVQDFRITAGATPPGTCLVGGIEVSIPADTTYLAQPGVPALTTPNQRPAGPAHRHRLSGRVVRRSGRHHRCRPEQQPGYRHADLGPRETGMGGARVRGRSGAGRGRGSRRSIRWRSCARPRGNANITAAMITDLRQSATDGLRDRAPAGVCRAPAADPDLCARTQRVRPEIRRAGSQHQTVRQQPQPGCGIGAVRRNAGHPRRPAHGIADHRERPEHGCGSCTGNQDHRSDGRRQRDEHRWLRGDRAAGARLCRLAQSIRSEVWTGRHSGQVAGNELQCQPVSVLFRRDSGHHRGHADCVANRRPLAGHSRGADDGIHHGPDRRRVNR